jgi:hypothetical protein
MNLPTVSKHPYPAHINFLLSSVIGRFSFFFHLLLDTEKFGESGFLKELPGANRRLPAKVSCSHQPLLGA